MNKVTNNSRSSVDVDIDSSGAQEIMQSVLSLEAQALVEASQKIGPEQASQLSKIYDYLLQSSGSLVFCGVGKSGLIAGKLAATFSSLGRPSFFLHPTEALHGDLGRVTSNDVIVFISKSGTAEEILRLLPFLPMGVDQFVALIGDMQSPLAKKCSLVFDCSVRQEAGVNKQAPTTSSTLALAMGDAMAVLYEHKVGLSKEGFAVNHPGGILGKRLRMKVRDLMWQRSECPTLRKEESLKDAILAMTSKNVGGVAILDDHQKLLGIMVEGDIRRTFVKNSQGLDTKLEVIMNPNPITIAAEDLAFNALQLMEQRENQISILPVIDENKIFVGFIRLHDLIKEGLRA